MVEDDPARARSDHDRRRGVVPRLLPVSRGPHVISHRGPREEHHHQQQNRDPRRNAQGGGNHRKNDDHHVEKRNVRPHFDQALHNEVEYAAEIAHHAPDRNPDDVGERHERQREKDRHAKSEKQPGKNVPAGGVGPEQVSLRPAHEGGRRGFEHVLVRRVFEGVELKRRHQHPVFGALGRELFLQLAVVGLVRVTEAEGRAGQIGAVGRKMEPALVTHRERAAVDQEFAEKGEHDEPGEHQKRNVAAPDRAETPELFGGEGVQGHREIT